MPCVSLKLLNLFLAALIPDVRLQRLPAAVDQCPAAACLHVAAGPQAPSAVPACQSLPPARHWKPPPGTVWRLPAHIAACAVQHAAAAASVQLPAASLQHVGQHHVAAAAAAWLLPGSLPELAVGAQALVVAAQHPASAQPGGHQSSMLISGTLCLLAAAK